MSGYECEVAVEPSGWGLGCVAVMGFPLPFPINNRQRETPNPFHEPRNAQNCPKTTPETLHKKLPKPCRDMRSGLARAARHGAPGPLQEVPGLCQGHMATQLETIHRIPYTGTIHSLGKSGLKRRFATGSSSRSTCTTPGAWIPSCPVRRGNRAVHVSITASLAAFDCCLMLSAKVLYRTRSESLAPRA